MFTLILAARGQEFGCELSEEKSASGREDAFMSHDFDAHVIAEYGGVGGGVFVKSAALIVVVRRTYKPNVAESAVLFHGKKTHL